MLYVSEIPDFINLVRRTTFRLVHPLNRFVPNVPVAVVSRLDKSTYSREVHPLNTLASAVVAEMEVNELRSILFNDVQFWKRYTIALELVTVVRLDKSTDMRLEQPENARFKALALEIVVNPDRSASTNEVQS